MVLLFVLSLECDFGTLFTHVLTCRLQILCKKKYVFNKMNQKNVALDFLILLLLTTSS